MAHTTTVTPDGDVIRSLRERAGLSQSAVAEELGRSQPWLSLIENGRPTSRASLWLLATFYGARLGEPIPAGALTLAAPARAAVAEAA